MLGEITDDSQAPSIAGKRTRRKFSADYRLRIITEADACQYGELGALLRWEIEALFFAPFHMV